ncbi:hypothetical protein AJ79_05690 [Helicocarpus griseus UAMH5409]|uniref:SH3 domain-containing protein n=1 Tax=Helicocarpus griseus UAMH5409 TaxID=1447875 RepID=A0A2B7XLA7_9EURO|nr:hypothetical protein AJ79_05690 [Helicocarpus griseus UAMH5409]
MAHQQQHRHNSHMDAHAKRQGGGFLDRIMNRQDRRPTQEPEIVFVTVAPTFDGPIGGFRTQGPGLGPPVQPTGRPENRPTQKPTEEVAPKPTPKPTETEKSKPTKAVSKSTKVDPNTLATSVSSSSSGSIASPTGLDGLNQASQTAVPTTKSDGGMTTGAKAGMAIGIILGVGLIAAIALFFIRRKKQRDNALTDFDNEKPYNSAPASASPPPMTRTLTATAAPQLNIRPITQFSPDFVNGSTSGGFAAGVAAGAAGAGAGAARSLGEKPSPPPKTPNNDPNPFNDPPANPFDSPPPGSAPGTPAATNGVPGELTVRTPSPGDARTPSPETLGTGVAATGTAVAAGTVGAVAVRRSLGTGKPQEGAPPASPAMSLDSATAAAVNGPGGPPGPTNVHRVQLDFTPSMDDELELKAGQLVRLVHEYDDGWALCVRLDRSGQGVVPRTCLSARPVRPRPRNPSGQHGPRGPPPDGRSMSMSSQMSAGPHGSPRFQPPPNGRPGSPTGGYRPYPPPQARSMSPAQFPQVPGSPARIPQPRSMSPGPYGPGGANKPPMSAGQRRRSYSTGAAVSPNSPLPSGPSPPPQQRQQPQQPQPSQSPKPARSPPTSIGSIERKPVPTQSQG